MGDERECILAEAKAFSADYLCMGLRGASNMKSGAGAGEKYHGAKASLNSYQYFCYLISCSAHDYSFSLSCFVVLREKRALIMKSNLLFG
jgi:hypothetical protein